MTKPVQAVRGQQWLMIVRAGRVEIKHRWKPKAENTARKDSRGGKDVF